MTNKRVLYPILICFMVVLLVAPCLASYEIGFTGMPDLLESIIGHREEDLVEVYDKDGNYIFASSMGVGVGDRYINEENREYKVIKVNGKRATAEFVGKVDLLGGKNLLSSLGTWPPVAQAQNKNKDKVIAIYHTHSAESYKPGPAFQEARGEIYDVGEQLTKEFEKQGVQVLRSDDTFLPHDGAAYERSRRTAAELLKQRPDAVFDVHRDAIPRAEEYLTEVEGESMSKVRLVVGRQNPNMGPNEEMAKRLKAIADEKYPGLVKGIFYANGKYNQDLSPSALLFEFGTHVTTKEEAQRSAAALTDSVMTLLYGGAGSTGGGGAGTNQAQSSAGWKNLIWVVGIIAVVGIGFLFLNEGGIGGVSKRLKNFGTEEFANVLGRKRKKDVRNPKQGRGRKSEVESKKRK